MTTTHSAIKVDLKKGYLLIGPEKVAEQHISVKCCKCSHFRVISNSHKLGTSAVIHLETSAVIHLETKLNY